METVELTMEVKYGNSRFRVEIESDLERVLHRLDLLKVEIEALVKNVNEEKELSRKEAKELIDQYRNRLFAAEFPATPEIDPDSPIGDTQWEPTPVDQLDVKYGRPYEDRPPDYCSCGLPWGSYSESNMLHQLEIQHSRP